MNRHVRALRRACVLGLLTFVALAGFGTPTALGQPAPEIGTLDLISIKGVIDPPTADYLKTRLEEAERDGVVAAVLQLDTPGAVDVSVKDVIAQISESEVPVVVWVAPRGAQAASAGTFLAYAADLVYMAEATQIGPATPVSLSDDDDSSEASEAAASYIRELAMASGRNADWAESAVRDAASIDSSEAEEIGVIDGTASSLAALLQSMDGAEVATSDGGTVALETYDEAGRALTVSVRFQQMNLLQRLLHSVTGANTAYLLLLIGLFGLIFELYNPGIGLAAILGVIALLLGVYGLSVLPTNWFGVLLIAAAVIFFIVDLQIAGFGAWTIGGIGALIAGGVILFSGAEEVRVDGWVIGVAVLVTLVFFFSVMTAALRVRLRRPITGEEGIVGTIGEATTDIAPEGTVLSKGMLWRARTMEMGIAAGAKVEVKATEGLVLLVEPLHEDVDAHTS
jgi:membrane-bound serine protease (ClpP class)